MLLRALFWILLAYFIYKFVFDFLAPVLKVSLRMRQQMKDFQRHAGEQPANNQQSTSNQQSAAADNSKPTAKAGEYIDFEEVKEK